MYLSTDSTNPQNQDVYALWDRLAEFSVGDGDAALTHLLERFPVEVNRNSQRGFPRARKSDSVLPATTCGACDGEGILQGPQGACG